jgi:steroid Delta-isomerase
MPTPTQIRAAVREYAESFNKQDKQLFLGALSETVEQIDPVGTPARTGKQALAGFWDGVFSLCDSIEFFTRELFVTGDEAALTFHIIQHRKEGNDVTLDGVDIFASTKRARSAPSEATQTTSTLGRWARGLCQRMSRRKGRSAS